jgi:hypothetical protein
VYAIYRLWHYNKTQFLSPYLWPLLPTLNRFQSSKFQWNTNYSEQLRLTRRLGALHLFLTAELL